MPLRAFRAIRCTCATTCRSRLTLNNQRSRANARAQTLSTLKPCRRSMTLPGADAPKRSTASTSPRSPTYRCQPCDTPARAADQRGQSRRNGIHQLAARHAPGHAFGISREVCKVRIQPAGNFAAENSSSSWGDRLGGEVCSPHASSPRVSALARTAGTAFRATELRVSGTGLFFCAVLHAVCA